MVQSRFCGVQDSEIPARISCPPLNATCVCDLDKLPGAQPLPGPEMHCRSWNLKLLSPWACGFPFSLQCPGDFYKEGSVPLLSSTPFP